MSWFPKVRGYWPGFILFFGVSTGRLAQTHFRHLDKSVCKHWLNVCFTVCLPCTLSTRQIPITVCGSSTMEKENWLSKQRRVTVWTTQGLRMNNVWLQYEKTIRWIARLDPNVRIPTTIKTWGLQANLYSLSPLYVLPKLLADSTKTRLSSSQYKHHWIFAGRLARRASTSMGTASNALGKSPGVASNTLSGRGWIGWVGLKFLLGTSWPPHCDQTLESWL